MPSVHNFIEVGLTHSNWARQLIITHEQAEAQLSAGSLRQSDALSVDGFETYELAGGRMIELISTTNDSSGRCSIHPSDDHLARTCDFFIVRHNDEVSIRANIPQRVVTNLPEILNDLSNSVEFIAEHCPDPR